LIDEYERRICCALYALLLLRALQQADEDEMEMERHLSSNSAFTYANDNDSSSDMYADNIDNNDNNSDDDVSTDVAVRNGQISTVDSAAEDAVSETDRLIQRYNARQQQQQQQQQQPVSPTTDTDAGIDSAAASGVRSYTAADLYHLRECFEDSSDSDAAAAAAAAAATVGRARSSTVPYSYAASSSTNYHYDEAHAAATSSATASDIEGRSAAASAAVGAAATSAGRTTDSCDDTESAGAVYCGLTGKYQGYAASKQSGNTAVGAVLLSKAVQSAREEELCVLSLVCDAALSTVLARSTVVQLLLLLVEPQSTADSGGSSLEQACGAIRRAFASVLTSSSSRTRDAALRLLKLLVRSGMQSHSPLEHALHSAVWGNSHSSDTILLQKQQVSAHLHCHYRLLS
jgi:hypothetical protein